MTIILVLGLFFCCKQFDPSSGGIADEGKENDAKDFKHPGHQTHAAEVGIEAVGEEDEEEEGSVEEEAQELEVEEEGDAVHLGQPRRAAEDEQVGGGEEEAAEERFRPLIRVVFGKKFLQVEGLHNLEVKVVRERKAEEEEKMEEKRADEEPERMPTKDTDCKSHGSHVEDDAGDEEGEETEESLKKLKFLDNKVFHFLFCAPFIFF